MDEYFVYIMSNMSGTLYIGMTNNLERRVWQHKEKLADSFTRRYNVTLLVYLESFAHVGDAIAREKQMKNWTRVKKVALIESMNPNWLDLSAEWY